MKFFLSLLILATSFSVASPQLWTLENHTGTNLAQAEIALQSTTAHHPHHNSYFDWGRGQNGWGYCYEWTHHGYVLNGGRPVPNSYCERRRPSQYDWSRGMNGWGYCYQWTPYGVVMNEGQPVPNSYCERRRPSYYRWGHGQNGYTYCYQYTANGYVMNEGRPVDSYYCRHH